MTIAQINILQVSGSYLDGYTLEDPETSSTYLTASNCEASKLFSFNQFKPFIIRFSYLFLLFILFYCVLGGGRVAVGTFKLLLSLNSDIKANQYYRDHLT